eukprot:Blabericola_migrator_1__6705@NODE_338_length_9616_cov_89_769714_g272_i0_p7_GENE_NODE_338_length_9616_cov_89_769714_g272_i0NODE_338_length_9616_cov_89_769714_g272_i0_p7_ORF_typecomplete_len130_score24_34RRM_1/PF00076_22/2_7e19RRM_5/PF13893_6/4_3e12RRM_7/PF16367_5/3_3e06Nup35_RRM_2/PF14605_6/1_8e03Nup35_RRM_2/PF14605_6/0_0034OB_RNB/PF08206_11/6_9e03OB_RNB/PF08206_11/0_0027Limkainb1/PF11608_8/8_2e03Limkainb1/PF11608_8/0_007RRM_8/PF11835_8/0_011RRM_2/PF04059_12/0_085_NODE_338_length_9616_cov_89_7697
MASGQRTSLVLEHLKDLSQSRVKRTLFVGGLDEDAVTAEVLTDAFQVFGLLRHVEIPFNKNTNKNRGFGFVEYEEESDAKVAMENMNGSELLGRTIVVNLAQKSDRQIVFDPQPYDGYVLEKITELRGE